MSVIEIPELIAEDLEFLVDASGTDVAAPAAPAGADTVSADTGMAAAVLEDVAAGVGEHADGDADAEPASEADAAHAESESEADAAPALAERPTDPETLKAWREERGIPADGAYALPELEGREWSEADKAAFSLFSEAFAAADLSQAASDGIARAYAAHLDKLHAVDAVRDTEVRARLKEEWGSAVGAKKKAMREYLADARVFPNGLGKDLIEARLPDGRKLIHHPDAPAWLASLAASRDGVTSEDARIAEINHMMRSDRDGYFRTGADQELLGLLKKREQRAAGKEVPHTQENPIDRRLKEIDEIMRSDRDLYFREFEPEYRQLLAQKQKSKGARKA